MCQIFSTMKLQIYNNNGVETFSEHLCSPPVFSGFYVYVAQCLVFNSVVFCNHRFISSSFLVFNSVVFCDHRFVPSVFNSVVFCDYRFLPLLPLYCPSRLTFLYDSFYIFKLFFLHLRQENRKKERS